MGFFGRRNPPPSIWGRDGSEQRDLEIVTALAIKAFIDAGVPVDPYPLDEGAPAPLVRATHLYDADHVFYQLDPGRPIWILLDESEWEPTIARWVSLELAKRPAQVDIDAEVKSRLVSVEAVRELRLDYARPFAPGLFEVLCLDRRDSVEWMAPDDLVDRDIPALFDRARSNLIREVLPDPHDVMPGVKAIAGDSFFTASRIVDLHNLRDIAIGAMPFGLVFGVPHCQLLVFHVLRSARSVEPITSLAELVAANASPDAPGGPLSAATYYWRDGAVQQITQPDPSNGRIAIVADGAFGEALNQLP